MKVLDGRRDTADPCSCSDTQVII